MNTLIKLNMLLSKDTIFEMLVNYLLEIFPNLLPDDINQEKTFEDIGADWLDKKEIVFGMAEIFDFDISNQSMLEINSLWEIVDIIYEKIHS